MDVLPIELVIAISSSHPIAFARMIKADRRVYQYVCAPAGRNLFLLTCVEKRIMDKNILTYSLITGKLHSFFDMPAVIYPDGKQEWHQYDKRHRDDGPAITYSDGTTEWWIYGVKQAPII